jgi:hypothetical protein
MGRFQRLELLTSVSNTPTILRSGHTLPTRGTDGFPLSHHS